MTTHIQATFSTDIQPGSATITVKRTLDGAEVAGQTSGESQGSVATFVPTVDLDPGTYVHRLSQRCPQPRRHSDDHDQHLDLHDVGRDRLPLLADGYDVPSRCRSTPATVPQ